MREVLENVKEFFERDWTLVEKILVLTCCVLVGVIYGFLIAPIKKGISCGNNNGNYYSDFEDDFWPEDE